MLHRIAHKLYNGHRLVASGSPLDPYNPLNLPEYTMRMLFRDNVTPTFSKGTLTQISQSPNIWDVNYNDRDGWEGLCEEQQDLLEVLGANTDGVRNMVSMFYGCSALSAVSLFNTSSLNRMSWMFDGCCSLESIPQFNTTNVNEIDHAFNGCRKLKSIPLLDTSNADNFVALFQGCNSLTSVPLLDTNKVTNFGYMFAYCSSLSSVPLFDTSNAEYLYSMFQDCTSLTSIPLFNTNKVVDMQFTFLSCPNVQTGALALYQQASNQQNPPQNHYYTFYNCGSNTQTGAAELAQIPTSWGGTMA